jgi:hypothetical protein
MAGANPCRVLICDRDAKWSVVVRERLEEAGIRVVQTPYQAPNENAHAERFVRSMKEECLDRIIPIGEGHFRRAVSQFVAHSHRERNHKGGGHVDRGRTSHWCRPSTPAITAWWTAKFLHTGSVISHSCFG